MRESWGSILRGEWSRSTFHAARPHRRLLADLALLAVTAIWGSTFVMVKDAVAAYPVFSFMAIRFTFAALALAPLVSWRRRPTPPSPLPAREGGETLPSPRRGGAGGGVSAASFLIGLALFAGYGFQTSGLHLTTPAKAGFITGLSVVIVPVVAALLLREAPRWNAWLGVAAATVGLALLSLQADFSISPGDLLVFGCALAFAGHILLTGRFSPRHDPLLLTFGQVIVVAVLSAGAALIFDERPPLTGSVLFAAAFTGLLATSTAFGIQTLAQRFTTTTHTALIFAAEPVFAALFSFLLIGETLGPRQLLGCGLILAGMVVGEVRRET
ncbi:MAG: DMT family transporter [Chloroflexi bacterium]|nr:DMT family transporter [Chloroflexota bacterium]